MALPYADMSGLGALPGSDLPQFTMPQAPSGMFGGPSKLQQALLAAVAGFMARRSPQVANNIIGGLQDAQTLKQRLALAQQEREQQLQDQIALHQANQTFDASHPVPGEQERMLNLYASLPDSDPRKAVLGSMLQHPVAMDVTNPDGSVTRQYIYPGTIPQQPQAPRVFKSLPPGAVPLDGGPTQPASGGFLGS